MSIPSKPWESQPTWIPKQNWSITETIQQQSQKQISQTKETLKLVRPLKCYDTILTELQKDVKNFILVKTTINILRINTSWIYNYYWS